MIKICSEKAFPLGGDNPYQGLAFDGSSFYMTVKASQKIVSFDCLMHQGKCFKTCRTYTYLCYDKMEHCFWAAAHNFPFVLFQLNECFREIRKLTIDLSDEVTGIITGVAYHDKDNVLLVSLKDKLIFVEKNKMGHAFVIKKCSGMSIKGVTCVLPYVAYHAVKDSKQIITMYSEECGAEDVMDVPPEYTVESILFSPFKNADTTYRFWILAIKNACAPFLLEIEIKLDSLNISKQCNKTICLEKDCKPCDCEKPCNCKKPCDCEKPCNCKKPCDCEKPCEECKPCDCCCDMCCRERCSSVMESIALKGASTAHILNAEGEKLQKAIAEVYCFNELIEVNESVRKTIINVTHLEQILYNQLATVKECCSLCHKHQPPLCSCKHKKDNSLVL